MQARSFFLIAGLCAVFSCNTPSGSSYSQPVPQTTATSVMDAKDLDLSTVSDLIRSGKATDANTLQQMVNDPNSSINNVDLDKDGQIDPITVTEGQDANGKQFNLVANPATGEATTVATISLSNNVNNQVVVQAGYPAYVSGYQDYYYNYTVANNLAFMMWALSPRAVWVPSPYRSYGWYAPHAVFAPDYVSRTRTSYDTQLHVSPVPRAAAPSDYKQRAQTYRTPSSFGHVTVTPSTNNLNDRAKARDFRFNTGPTQRATGFGATPKSTPSQRVSTPSTRPSFSTPRPSGGGRSSGGRSGGRR